MSELRNIIVRKNKPSDEFARFLAKNVSFGCYGLGAGTVESIGETLIQPVSLL
jgi:hypothetical protein